MAAGVNVAGIRMAAVCAACLSVRGCQWSDCSEALMRAAGKLWMMNRIGAMEMQEDPRRRTPLLGRL